VFTHGRNCVWNNIYGRNYNNRNDIYDTHGRNDDIPRRIYNNGNDIHDRNSFVDVGPVVVSSVDVVPVVVVSSVEVVPVVVVSFADIHGRNHDRNDSHNRNDDSHERNDHNGKHTHRTNCV
jgi:hypothetical protein